MEARCRPRHSEGEGKAVGLGRQKLQSWAEKRREERRGRDGGKPSAGVCCISAGCKQCRRVSPTIVIVPEHCKALFAYNDSRYGNWILRCDASDIAGWGVLLRRVMVNVMPMAMLAATNAMQWGLGV